MSLYPCPALASGTDSIYHGVDASTLISEKEEGGK